MANILEVVRVTYEELIAENIMEKELNEKKKKENKRPSRAIYQPGVSRLSRSKEQNNEKNETESSSSSTSKQDSALTKLHSPSNQHQGRQTFSKVQQKSSAPEKSHKPGYSEEHFAPEKSRHPSGGANQQKSSAPQKSHQPGYSEDHYTPEKSRQPSGSTNQQKSSAPQKSHQPGYSEDHYTPEKSRQPSGSTNQQKSSAPQKSHQPGYSEDHYTPEKSRHPSGGTNQQKSSAPQKSHIPGHSEDHFAPEKSRHPSGGTIQRESNQHLISNDENPESNIKVFTQVFTRTSCRYQRSGGRDYDVGSSNSQQDQMTSKPKIRPLMEGIPESRYKRTGGRDCEARSSNSQQGQTTPKPKIRPLMEGIPERKDIKTFGRGRGRGRSDHSKHSNSNKPQSPKSNLPKLKNRDMMSAVNQRDDNQSNIGHLESEDEGLTITVDVTKKSNQRQVSTQKNKNRKYDASGQTDEYFETDNVHVNPDSIIVQIPDHQVVPIPSENWPSDSDSNIVKVLSENWQEVEYNDQSMEETYQSSDTQGFVRSSPESIVKIVSENISHVPEIPQDLVPEKHQDLAFVPQKQHQDLDLVPEKHQDFHEEVEEHDNREEMRRDDRRKTSGSRRNGQRNKKAGTAREEYHHQMDNGDLSYLSKNVKDMKLSITVNKNVREVRNISNVSRSRNSSESEDERRRNNRKDRHHSGRSQGESDHVNRNHADDWKREHLNRSKQEDWKSEDGNRGHVQDLKREPVNRSGEPMHRGHVEDLRREPVSRGGEPEQSKPRSGGILKLPSNTGNVAGTPPKAQPQMANNSRSSQYNAHHAHHEPRPQRPQEHRGRSKRGDQSRLWDPSRPNEKPAIARQAQQHDELQFRDPDDDENHYDYHITAGPNQGYPNQYTAYNNQQPGGGSWADQTEASFSEQPQDYYHQMPPPPTPEYLQQTQALQTLHRDSAKRLLRDAERYRDDLRNIIDRRLNSNERIAKVFETRNDLEQQYEGVVLLDLNLCHEKGVEQILWKYAYHQVIEAMRTELQGGDDAEDVAMFKSCLLKLLDHGTSFYEGLITKLQSSYGFNLQHHTTCLDPLHSEKTRKIKLCLLSAQRCMIALGDLARYKEHTNDTSNFGKARSWYLKAQQLAPRNGRPYNQLALLALSTRRKLDAVYYYIRSLEASNPFESARESLNTLFEEVRRKVAFAEQSKIEAYKKKTLLKRQRTKQHNNELNARKEVWISHDGHRLEERKGDIEDEEDDELAKLTPVELNKRFVLSFLNVHGKLFTKIGMETFTMAVEGLLNEFAGLLNHSPPPINSTRLLQLMAINMFSVNHTGYKDSKDIYHYGRTPLQEQAIQVGLQMFALLLNSSTQLLQEHIESDSLSEGNVLNEDLRELLPGVKVWADWMMSHVLLWEQPLLNPNHYSATKDVWEEIANLLNAIITVDSSPINFSLKKTEGWQEVVLPEDAVMAGFVPLQTIPLQPFYIPPGQDKIPAMDKVRVNALVTWGNIMEGQERPLVAYSASSKQYYSCAPSRNHQVLTNDQMPDDYLNIEKDVILEGVVYDEEDASERETDGNIRMLKLHKEELQRKLEEQNRKEREIEAIVESHRTQRQLILEISPVYLVADTNCFIDHLQIIQCLLETKRYTLVVPLVVINELDGLSRGGRDDQNPNSGRTTTVSQSATQAVEYLEDAFDNHNRHIRALTAQGTVLQSISFRTEESSNKGNNDDLILNCCVFYCSDKARDYMPKEKDAPMYLRREVVLLTDDRNLRVKALNRNVPVKDIVGFSKWAKIQK